MTNQTNTDFQVAVIGAGPSGACIANLLQSQGVKVIVFEREAFPRFSIGESLLPQCLCDLEEAGLLEGLESETFQLKRGAAFLRGEQYIDFNFSEKFTSGLGYAYQVKRAGFDKNLADQCVKNGVPIRYNHKVKEVVFDDDSATLLVENLSLKTSEKYKVKFVADASGFGRVLPKILGLDQRVSLPARFSLFSYLEDGFKANIDREKILIVVNKKRPDIWYWVIPFSDGTISIGVVGGEELLDDALSDEELFLKLLDDCPELLLRVNYRDFTKTKVRKIKSYSCGSSALFGKNYVLLGNAGEFIDPVFSSGVTIACRSACLAAPLIVNHLEGKQINWKNDYSDKLAVGIDVFRAFVDLWYDGTLMEIFLANDSNKKIREMVCSILAGYAWDVENPMVKDTRRRLGALSDWVQINQAER